MKPSLLVGSTALAVALGCASSSSSGGGMATVQFIEPQRFTDFIEDGPAPANFERLAGQLTTFIEQKGREVVPAGRRLELAITDIDLAGRLVRGPRNLRIAEGNQSAEVRLDYRLLDAGGQVLRQGSERLVRHPSDLGVSTAFDDSGLELVRDGIGVWMRGVVRETAVAAK